MHILFNPRSISRLMLAAGAVLLAACARDATAPASATSTREATSMFVPSAAAKAMIGVTDGSYVVTFDPRRDQSIPLGPNSIEIPSDAVCDLETSGYGASFWDRPCTPERQPVTLTIIIKNAASAHPSLDFRPAMRFNPSRTVQLYMYAPRVSKDDARNWLMYYCPDKGKCVDESLADKSLATSIDKANKMLFRRVKHFSGYTVAERSSDEM
ncbi:MAG: hypothetical protein ABJA80_13960 [bacterium]